MSHKICVTSDYSLFELGPFNRDVENRKLLLESMRQHGWSDAYPMHVYKGNGDKLFIKGGHQRFEVARQLGIPVKYVITTDNMTIVEIERTTTPWGLKHYLNCYVRLGYIPYITVKQYHDKTGIGLSQCISMLGGESAGSSNKNKFFREGTYELGDAKHADIIADLVLYLRKLGIKWSSNIHLVNALSKVAWVKEFSPRIFKQKAALFTSLFQKQVAVEGYIKNIETIYNRQSQDKIPLSFLADEIAKERAILNRQI